MGQGTRVGGARDPGPLSTPASIDGGRRPVRVVAFYLPQFHPIPENDRFWGPGFTDWVKVAATDPRFPGHEQPHLPGDLGFYDLRVAETRSAQAALARRYGVDAFCWWHYWFRGRRVLERPFAEVLASGEPDLPFCLAWANENWTRRWDGRDDEVLLRQEYDAEDDRAHLRALLPALHDRRALRVGDRPLFAVYRATSLPEPRRTTDAWREEAARGGLPGLYLCTIRSLPELDVDPRPLGFDAAIDFQPDWRHLPPAIPPPAASIAARLSPAVRAARAAYANNLVLDYDALVAAMRARPQPAYPLFPGVTPAWDNAARRARGAVIVRGSTPEAYGRWLAAAIADAERLHAGDERLVFVNAWNEWAEGNHLEPCRRWGHRYLEATLAATTRAGR